MPPFPPYGNPPGGPMPMGPPPSSAPPKPAQARSGSATKMVSPGSMKYCIGRFTYIWMSNGQEFWFFPIQIWRNSVSGFRWDRRFGWSYTGISLNRIDMFTCSW
ncbi:transporter [Bacteroides xylanolyticus]|uniref:Transporter n=2 Tax=Lacrimispora defluvii TaxID=2719233 RepID=A0ABX1VPP8_9FIRM|nr:transporter [Lacrimispora defluvii]